MISLSLYILVLENLLLFLLIFFRFKRLFLCSSFPTAYNLNLFCYASSYGHPLFIFLRCFKHLLPLVAFIAAFLFLFSYFTIFSFFKSPIVTLMEVQVFGLVCKILILSLNIWVVRGLGTSEFAFAVWLCFGSSQRASVSQGFSGGDVIGLHPYWDLTLPQAANLMSV